MSADARGSSLHPLPPSSPTDLAHFPHRTVEGEWVRAHIDRGGRDRGCWWFASVGPQPDSSGRFDLAEPRGTCYFASSAEVAVRERLGTQLRQVAGSESVTATALATPDGAVLVTTVSHSGVRAANLAVKPAQRWINRSLSVGTGIYAVTQAWAAAFDRAGFDALVYVPRFAGGVRARSLAVFGNAGRPRPLHAVGRSRPIEDVLLELGIRVAHPPASAPAVLAPADAPPPL